MRRDAIPFHPQFNEAILTGRKTVTRRFKPRHVESHLRAKNPIAGKPPGQWPGFADLIVVSCQSIRLLDLDEQEAKLEGLASVLEFASIWNGLYSTDEGRRWSENPPVWRIEFRLENAHPIIEEDPNGR